MSNQQKGEVVVVSSTASRTVASARRGLSSVTQNKKKTARFAGVFVLIAIIVTVVMQLFLNRLPVDSCNGNPDSNIYARAANVMNPGAINNLQSIVNEIKVTDGYDTDATCQYVAIHYYVSTGDAVAAREVLGTFSDLKDKSIKGPVKNFERSQGDLTQTVDYLEKASQFLLETSGNLNMSPPEE